MSAADVIDRVLEALLVPSFSRVGIALRRRLDHWQTGAPGALEGKVFVVTGATSGIGRATAVALVRQGATVEIVARDTTKAAVVCETLRGAAQAGHVSWVQADLSDLSSVRTAAVVLLERHDRLHGLVHNAGALDASYAATSEGIEHTAASQVVGPFLFTSLLESALRAGSGRIVWVSSGGMYSQPLSVADLDPAPADYDGTKAYARAKRAQVVLAEMWAERLLGSGVVVHAMHPGWADTPGVARSLPRFRRIMGPLLRDAQEGADTIVWLLTDDHAPRETTGRFWLDRRPRSTHRLRSTRRRDTPEERTRLWQWCNEHASLDLAVPGD
ncbi:MAG: SDR family NAD(P)-dependent oxidoreductase [Actinobacteria bacterium]|nr:SDR family NAD(P)-dependent oxidoreductase [Actinomycetota bacterium]